MNEYEDKFNELKCMKIYIGSLEFVFLNFFDICLEFMGLSVVVCIFIKILFGFILGIGMFLNFRMFFDLYLL